MEKNLKLPVNENQKIDGFQNNYLFSSIFQNRLLNFIEKINIINVN